MSDSKIQVKVGIVEFSGEGEQKWLAEQLDKILEKVPELLKIEISHPSSFNGEVNNNGINSNGSTLSGMSIINIAGKLGCKSGADLAIASCAYMHFMEEKKTFTRDDITQVMKKATGFYKDSFQANLTTTLARLEGNNTITKSGSLYALHITKANEVNALLTK